MKEGERQISLVTMGPEILIYILSARRIRTHNTGIYHVGILYFLHFPLYFRAKRVIIQDHHGFGVIAPE